jgi:hypothetical protein
MKYIYERYENVRDFSKSGGNAQDVHEIRISCQLKERLLHPA